MIIERITSLEDNRIDDIFKLFVGSFDKTERRDVEQIKTLIVSESRMHLCAIMVGEEFAGFINYWDLGEFYYGEYFAILDSMRNQNIGTKVLEWIKNNLKGTVIIEVEHPLDDIKTRRIQYYERNGYAVIDKSYRQPDFRIKDRDYPLWIMANTEIVNTEMFINTIKERIYFDFM